MEIRSDFECGNIRVIEVSGDTVLLQNDLRDTVDDWFYWAFSVSGAGGRTVTFRFDKDWIGPFGPAVSYDLINWRWLERRGEDSSFTYHFDDDGTVYFAHDMVYTPSRLNTALRELELEPNTLCRSRRGRDVPYLTLGEGDKLILLTSRHHACESPGSYLLEGFLREFGENPIEGVRLFVVPMVDFDGVCDGDQGKDRAPHDHNRDYTDAPIYPEVRAIKETLSNEKIYMAIDLHAPGHFGEQSKRVFIMRKGDGTAELFDRLGSIFERESRRGGVIYDMRYDRLPNGQYNGTERPTCSNYFATLPDTTLSFTLETTYFGSADNKVSQDKLIATGRALCRSIGEFTKKQG